MKALLAQNKWLLVLVVTAFCLRLYALGSLPAGLTWDEAAIGYNGYAIVTTRRDEWLEKLPISFKSFGDYKSPFAIYLTGIFTYIFGLSPLVVRLPFALAGVFTIPIFYLLCMKLYKGFERAPFLSLTSTFLLTLSPWHIHFTRVGFESGLALFIFMLALWLLFEFFQTIYERKSYALQLGIGLAAGLSCVATLYTYHSAKIVVPLMVLVTVWLFSDFKKIIRAWKPIVVVVLISSLAVWPLLQDALFGMGATRAGVLIFSEHLTIVEYSQIILSNYILHLSPLFLLQGATNTLRHGTGVWGVLLLTTYLLNIVGLLGYWSSRIKKQDDWYTKVALWSILMIVIGLLPAVLTREVPHPNRALFALPGFIVLATIGLKYLIDSVNALVNAQKFYYSQALIGTFYMVHIVLFISFWNYYLIVYPARSSDSFQEGYIEAFTLAKDYEKGENGKPQVEKILFSSEYGQPYIYALFVRKTNPIWYRGGSLIKYEFTDTISPGDLSRNNTLLVATQKNILPNKEPDHIVYGRDGSIRFALYLTPGSAPAEN